MRNRLVLLSGLAAVFAAPSAALAHRMLLTVEVTAAAVRVAVKYDGADHGGEGPTVKLFTHPGKELVEKKPTDEQGLAVFAKPAVGTYLVVAEDEFHDAEKVIDVTAEGKKYEDEPANRWLMIAVGVAAIAGLTAVGWYVSKPKPA